MCCSSAGNVQKQVQDVRVQVQQKLVCPSHPPQPAQPMDVRVQVQENVLSHPNDVRVCD